MIAFPLLAGLAVAIALLQGIGGALEKKGVTQLVRKLGGDGLAPSTLFTRLPDLVVAVVTTPTFLLGLIMVTVLGGGLFMVALSLGDGAKVGLFVAALASACYLAANVAINQERMRPLHLVGIGLGIAGAVCIALAGFRAAA